MVRFIYKIYARDNCISGILIYASDIFHTVFKKLPGKNMYYYNIYNT